MRLPSKVTPFSKSTIAHFPAILEPLESEELTPSELYKKAKSKCGGMSGYLDALDCLYALGKIEITPEGMLRYVD